MEFDDDNNVESSSDSTTKTESKIQNNSSENDDETEKNDCTNNDTPMTTVTPSSSSDEAVEAVEEITNPEESTNEATACSTSELPQEKTETEEVTKDCEEKVNSSCETLTKHQDDVSEPGSTEDNTAASSEVVESTD